MRIETNNSGKTWINSISTKLLYAGVLLTYLAFTTTEAKAITVGGEEYEKILSFYTGSDDFGFWSRSDKFFTFRSNDNYIRPNRVHSVQYKDPKLADVSFSEVQAMGKTSIDDKDVTSGIVDVYGPGSLLLFSASYVSNGTQSHILRSGTAGQLNVNGVFEVTSGALFDRGIINGQIYLEIAYDRAWKNDRIDYKTDRGTWTFYERGNNPTEVPEPMSMMLLASGLLAGTKLKRKKILI